MKQMKLALSGAVIRTATIVASPPDAARGPSPAVPTSAGLSSPGAGENIGRVESSNQA